MKRRLVLTESDETIRFHKRFRTDCAQASDVYDMLTDDAWSCVASWLVHIDRLALKLVCKQSAMRDRAYTCGIPWILSKICKAPDSPVKGAIRAFMRQELHVITRIDYARWEGLWTESAPRLQFDIDGIPGHGPMVMDLIARTSRPPLGRLPLTLRFDPYDQTWHLEAYKERVRCTTTITGEEVNHLLARIEHAEREMPSEGTAGLYRHLLGEVQASVLRDWKPLPSDPAFDAVAKLTAARAHYDDFVRMYRRRGKDYTARQQRENEMVTALKHCEDEVKTHYAAHMADQERRSGDVHLRVQHDRFKSALMDIGLAHRYLDLVYECDIHTVEQLVENVGLTDGMIQDLVSSPHWPYRKQSTPL